MEVEVKTISLKSIQKIDSRPCKIVYNGAGNYEVDIEDTGFRVNLNYIVNRPCETENDSFTIKPGDKLRFLNGRVGQIITDFPDSFGIRFENGEEWDFVQLPETFMLESY